MVGVHIKCKELAVKTTRMISAAVLFAVVHPDLWCAVQRRQQEKYVEVILIASTVLAQNGDLLTPPHTHVVLITQGNFLYISDLFVGT